MSCKDPQLLHLGNLFIALNRYLTLIGVQHTGSCEGKATYLCLGRCLVGNTAETDSNACAILLAVDSKYRVVRDDQRSGRQSAVWSQ